LQRTQTNKQTNKQKEKPGPRSKVQGTRTAARGPSLYACTAAHVHAHTRSRSVSGPARRSVEAQTADRLADTPIPQQVPPSPSPFQYPVPAVEVPGFPSAYGNWQLNCKYRDLCGKIEQLRNQYVELNSTQLVAKFDNRQQYNF
jgi:hypothetical protein